MNCKKHPKYKAILKPGVDCWNCWRMYLGTVMELREFVLNKMQELTVMEAPYGHKNKSRSR